MNVLLIGGPCQLMDNMVDIVNKNGHKSYLLMDGGKHSSAYRHAFEKYSFPYQDESIRDVMLSIEPDVVLFLGAQDTSFAWAEKGSRELSRYTASIANIISVYASSSKGRFIYLSSEEIYGDRGETYVSGMSEETIPSPDGYRAMAIMQGESICENCRMSQKKDVVILRLDHLFGMPRKGQSEGDICFRQCLDAIKTGIISAPSKDTLSLLHVKDAAAFIYAVMSAEDHKYGAYQLSSMQEMSQLDLARMISEEAGFPVEALAWDPGAGKQQMLDATRFTEEFNLTAIADTRKEVREIIRFMAHNKSSFLTAEEMAKKKGLRAMIKIALPFVENVICCVIFSLLNSQAVGSRYFAKLDFLLLYVLLFAIMHGQQQAILSALLASLAYFFQEMSGRTGFEVLLDYNTYVWMAQLFIVGMAVGITKDRMRHIHEEQREEILFLRNRVKNIEEINDSNVRMKQGFETELVNQKESLLRIYELTSRLEQYAPEEVLFYAAEVLQELMGSREVAIYLVANQGYARLFTATSPQARQLGASYAYASSGEMYETLKDHRVFVNYKMDEALPMMASAVFAQDEMQFIFMVWGIPWQRMNLAEANRLMIGGALIQNSVIRSRRYLEALKEQRYLAGTQIMQPEAFVALVNAFMDARNRSLTECVLLEIVTDKDKYAQASQALGKSVRQTDYMGLLNDGKLCVLLANTNEAKSEDVVKRFQKVGYEARLRKVR